MKTCEVTITYPDGRTVNEVYWGETPERIHVRAVAGNDEVFFRLTTQYNPRVRVTMKYPTYDCTSTMPESEVLGYVWRCMDVGGELVSLSS